MMSSMGGGPGGAMSFGKSNAKYVKSSTGIKFTDVAGEDEGERASYGNCRLSSQSTEIHGDWSIYTPKAPFL